MQQDEKSLERLKNKLNTLLAEVKDLRCALILEEKKKVQEEHGEWSDEQVDQEAERRVEHILQALELQ